MIGVGRKNYQNNQKAIDDVLQKFASGTFSERRARLELDSLGVSPAKADIYIEDASDGTVDTPEEELTSE